jgi:hypothetical protein
MNSKFHVNEVLFLSLHNSISIIDFSLISNSSNKQPVPTHSSGVFAFNLSSFIRPEVRGAFKKYETSLFDIIREKP